MTYAGSDHDLGLSPRERGNQLRCLDGRMAGRSIPARAGEPHHRALFSAISWVYPRASGGTMGEPAMFSADFGLSPRERGNPGYLVDVWQGIGSIPARAGEPH